MPTIGAIHVFELQHVLSAFSQAVTGSLSNDRQTTETVDSFPLNFTFPFKNVILPRDYMTSSQYQLQRNYFVPAGESICIFDYTSQGPMLIKLRQRCASNPNKVCFLQKSNGSSNGKRDAKVECRASLPSGTICVGQFFITNVHSFQKSCSSSETILVCTAIACLRTLPVCTLSGIRWAELPNQLPSFPSSLPLQKPIHVFQSLS